MDRDPRATPARRAYNMMVAQFARLERPGLKMHVAEDDGGKFAMHAQWFERTKGKMEGTISFSTVMGALEEDEAEVLLADILERRGL